MARLKASQSPKLRTARATSAGGVVVRHTDRGPEICLGLRRREGDTLTWTLPKGTPTAGETRDETALREVTEETGLAVRILSPVGELDYYFVLGGTRYHKTVHYYLMEPFGGDLRDHDHEFEDVRWVAWDEAEELLSYQTEREIVARARVQLDGLTAGRDRKDDPSDPPSDPASRSARLVETP